MLEDLKLPTLQQRRLESRLVMLYKVVRGMVPAINADEFLIPLGNKTNIKPRLCSDFQTTNFVQRYSVNHIECFKIPESKSDQFKNAFFVRTVSDWNQLEECQIRAETVNNFRQAVTHRGCRSCQNWILPLLPYRYRYRINRNSLLVKHQIDNSKPGGWGLTGGD